MVKNYGKQTDIYKRCSDIWNRFKKEYPLNTKGMKNSCTMKTHAVVVWEKQGVAFSSRIFVPGSYVSSTELWKFTFPPTAASEMDSEMDRVSRSIPGEIVTSLSVLRRHGHCLHIPGRYTPLGADKSIPAICSLLEEDFNSIISSDQADEVVVNLHALDCVPLLENVSSPTAAATVSTSNPNASKNLHHIDESSSDANSGVGTGKCLGTSGADESIVPKAPTAKRPRTSQKERPAPKVPRRSGAAVPKVSGKKKKRVNPSNDVSITDESNPIAALTDTSSAQEIPKSSIPTRKRKNNQRDLQEDKLVHTDSSLATSSITHPDESSSSATFVTPVNSPPVVSVPVPAPEVPRRSRAPAHETATDSVPGCSVDSENTECMDTKSEQLPSEQIAPSEPCIVYPFCQTAIERICSGLKDAPVPPKNDKEAAKVLLSFFNRCLSRQERWNLALSCVYWGNLELSQDFDIEAYSRFISRMVHNLAISARVTEDIEKCVNEQMPGFESALRIYENVRTNFYTMAALLEDVNFHLCIAYLARRFFESGDLQLLTAEEFFSVYPLGYRMISFWYEDHDKARFFEFRIILEPIGDGKYRHSLIHPNRDKSDFEHMSNTHFVRKPRHEPPQQLVTYETSLSNGEYLLPGFHDAPGTGKCLGTFGADAGVFEPPITSSVDDTSNISQELQRDFDNKLIVEEPEPLGALHLPAPPPEVPVHLPEPETFGTYTDSFDTEPIILPLIEDV